ncbi:hypothetical protein AURDEDRAFT_167455 [Auricularia subglabra TFB-10046 SS5]|nr:hypothetical protein AURDEDRAFT_167455 [Auricularia subglabra TFB-10046 SS5]
MSAATTVLNWLFGLTTTTFSSPRPARQGMGEAAEPRTAEYAFDAHMHMHSRAASPILALVLTPTWALQIPGDTLPREQDVTGSVSHFIQAVAIGAGFRGSVLEDEVEVSVVHATWPYGIDFDSPHLTVGGLMRFHLRLLAPPTEPRIRAIIVELKQSVAARPPGTPDAEPSTLSRCVPMFILDHSTPRQPSVPNRAGWMPSYGCGVSFAHDARVPGHRALRPTSDRASPAFIRVAHELVVRFRYWKEDHARERVVTFTAAVELAHCCFRLDTVLLPMYDLGEAACEKSPGCACTLGADQV